MLEARFSDAEFAANLALVDQGEGGEEYTDPAAFFRITYAREGLQRVLMTTIARLAGKGGDPVIGLQTNFGGGKTHTMLVLHHLAGAVEAGYRAVATIADPEAAGTNPGSERLIPILRDAAPCLILMDEVVAFARQLRGLEYNAFHAFIQSLTEATAAAEGAGVVGSLPESGAEVGDEQGRDALRRLEKIFGRVQSACPL